MALQQYEFDRIQRGSFEVELFDCVKKHCINNDLNYNKIIVEAKRSRDDEYIIIVIIKYKDQHIAKIINDDDLYYFGHSVIAQSIISSVRDFFDEIKRIELIKRLSGINDE